MDSFPRKPRVIFLDVDGPLINGPMFYIDLNCSIHRTVFNTMAIAFLKRMVKITGAKIVMNTMHNNHEVFGRNIKQDLLRWGLKEEDFHEDWRTEFAVSIHGNRLDAIHTWLMAHDDPDWVCFDDELFTTDRRLISIDYDKGIDYTAYRKAMKVFGYRNEPETRLIYFEKVK